MKKNLRTLLAAVLALSMLFSVALATDADSLKGADFSYPIGEGAALTLWTDGLAHHSDYLSEEESPFHQFIEEATGVDITWVRPAAGADGTQAYNLMIMTGELPDIIFKGSLPAEAEAMIADEVFLPIEDYMADYAPALNAILEADPDTAKAIRSDSGHLYAFPFLREDVSWLGTWLGASVNTTMLAEAGLEAPETLAEWETMAYTFKEMDSCDYPISFYSSSHPRALFGNAFGFNGYDNYYITKEGEVATWMNAEGYRDFLETMNRWYTDGVIDPDFMTMDLTGFVTRFVANRIGATVYGSATPGRFHDQIVERDGSYDYVGVNYPVMNKGDEILFCQGEPLWTGQGAVVTTACENVPLALRFLDYGYTEEGMITWNYGKEGVSYYVDENGERHMNDEILNAEEGATLALQRYTSMTANGISIMMLDWNKGKQLPLAIELVDNWTKSTPNAALYRWPAVSATVEENEELANIESPIRTYANEMYINFIIGTESLDNYDAYIDTLNSMNLDRVLEIKAEQLARYNAR